MVFKRKEKKQKIVDTIISEGTVIEGNITHKTSLRIDGKVHGEITCEGDVYIGKTGYIDSIIRAKNIVVSGEVNGDIHAFERAHIQSTGKLTGSVTTKGIMIDEGGILNGKSIIETEEASKAQPSTKLTEENRTELSQEETN